MPHIDFKVTVWNRAHFGEGADIEKIIEKLKNGSTSGELCDEDNGLHFTGEWETILDTEEQVSVENNNGISTIQVYTDDCAVPIWENGKPAI